VIEHHERLLDQRLEQVDDVHRRKRLCSAHFFGGGEVEAAHEDAEPGQDLLLVGAQQNVGPVDQRAQRLLSFQQDASAAGQQA
jgi:hypothetical protein